jgi:hypothetical protein
MYHFICILGFCLLAMFVCYKMFVCENFIWDFEVLNLTHVVFNYQIALLML